MHILYVDESICNIDSKEYFIFSGVSVFERQVYWLTEELNRIAAGFNADNPNHVELHATHMLGGKKGWRKHPKAHRKQAIKAVLSALDSKRGSRIFASVIDKDKHDRTVLNGEADKSTVAEAAFLQIASRFDLYIKRQRAHAPENNQRGLMLFDKSKNEATLQALTRIYRDQGHKWGRLHSICEVPVFIDSKLSRPLQLADVVAWAINKQIQGENEFYEIISGRFDYDPQEKKKHGLHVFADQDIVRKFK